MAGTSAALLIIDGDRESVQMLTSEADARGYRTRVVPSAREAVALIESEVFDAVLVDLAPGADAAFELLARLRDMAADTEVLVMSRAATTAATIQWFDPDAFDFVRKTDVVQVFGAVARALERRRITAQNRRLVWELQTINEIASGISASLELQDILAGALQRLVRAMDAISGSIRLRDDLSGVFRTEAIVGPASLRTMLAGQWPGVTRPSDQVIATRGAVIVEDFVDLVSGGEWPVPLRSAISVPMLAGGELLGTVSVGSTRPRRFTVADQRLLAIIAGQIVVAVQNARLHLTIRRAKREWERTFDAISEPIAVYNNRGELLRGNKALAEHLSRGITTIRQLSCREVGLCGGVETCAACAVTRALQQQPSKAEVTLPDGQIFSVTTFPIGVPSDGPSVVQVAKNVTEEIRSARRLQQMSTELTAANGRLVTALDQLKSTQAQLVQAEKLSAIGQLVAGVAHELNNPLTSVIGYAQLLEEELRQGPISRPAPEVSQDLRRIAEESERAARIVRNLLAFARRQSAERSPQDIADLCSRVLSLRQYEFKMIGIDLRVDLPGQLPYVMGDSGQLQQVLLNLILNAEHAMRGCAERRLQIAASYAEDADAIQVMVSDSGEGIDRANLSRIFDPFFTTREVGQGTGLGLSICYGIVRDHGGHIDVVSERGSGTTFTVTLPARCEPPGAPGMEILVAHGGQAEREFIGAALSAWGYRPLLASTPGEAFEGCRRSAPQLAIVDRGMIAQDREGWREIASDGRQLPIIVTSRTPDDEALEVFEGTQALRVVVAPIRLAALRAAVRATAKEYA
jgi:two-component system NtrC family sensor kinase